ncbi:S-adenosyl-L-methionine-dependent methyltransferase [Myriangium duriaei CBS 260.36]|uniref:S-adenosyl-L-methionine-dependent methyltransferase n=1 Tax=Myriangium duriaei CBS 260.36 TaxID=1168546 RepID=A0A9P4JCJ2_9PEZI|nr:S-adenosyl-L-methionine-dependent methyltransferase [Myriangium duriaei CBS 260.36]
MDYDSLVNLLLDNGVLPFPIIRQGIRSQLRSRLASLASTSVTSAYDTKMKYIDLLRTRPIAVETAKANDQHYEVGTGVLAACLGPRMKYSCCRYYDLSTGKALPGLEEGWTAGVLAESEGVISQRLGRAEEAMLEEYVEKAGLEDGQRVFDLGCGWGSLALYVAERFPGSRVTAFSNSRTQKIYIDGKAKEKGLGNLEVVTGDIATWEVPGDRAGKYDRVLSVEMFEHMKNYALLLKKVAGLLKPRGKAFVHLFAHKDMPYDFESGWMTEHFFTGGTMPSLDLLTWFQEDLNLRQMWYVNGRNYARTCEDWLARMNANKKDIWPHLEETYGKEKARMWFYRWQVFYAACAELFAYGGGEVWGVGLYLFEKPETPKR